MNLKTIKKVASKKPEQNLFETEAVLLQAPSAIVKQLSDSKLDKIIGEACRGNEDDENILLLFGVRKPYLSKSCVWTCYIESLINKKKYEVKLKTIDFFKTVSDCISNGKYETIDDPNNIGYVQGSFGIFCRFSTITPRFLGFVYYQRKFEEQVVELLENRLEEYGLKICGSKTANEDKIYSEIALTVKNPLINKGE